MKVKGSWNWILLECQLKERVKNKRGREDGEIVCCMLTSYRWSTGSATIQTCISFEWAVPMTHPRPYSCCMSPWSCDYDSGTWCLAHDYDIAVFHHQMVTIWDLLCPIPINKNNGETSRRSQIVTMWHPSLTTAWDLLNHDDRVCWNCHC